MVRTHRLRDTHHSALEFSYDEIRESVFEDSLWDDPDQRALGRSETDWCFTHFEGGPCSIIVFLMDAKGEAMKVFQF